MSTISMLEMHQKLEGLKYGVFFLSMVFKELESSLKVHISLIAIW